MVALLAQDSDDMKDEEWALTVVSNQSSRHFIDKLVILVLESYEKTINDPIWRKLWLEAIKAELTALIFNET